MYKKSRANGSQSGGLPDCTEVINIVILIIIVVVKFVIIIIVIVIIIVQMAVNLFEPFAYVFSLVQS